MPTIDVETLERTTRDIFAARLVPPADAALIAEMLVRANLRGHDSHGVIRIPQYCAALASGTLNPAPNITTVLDRRLLAYASVCHGRVRRSGVPDGDFRRGLVLEAGEATARCRSCPCGAR